MLRTTDKNTLDLGVAKSWPFSPGAPFVGDALVGCKGHVVLSCVDAAVHVLSPRLSCCRWASAWTWSKILRASLSSCRVHLPGCCLLTSLKTLWSTLSAR